MSVLTAVVAAGAVVLSQKPDELLNQITGRRGSISALHHLPDSPANAFRLRTRSLPPVDLALVRTFMGHTDDVTGCAFSPDGRTVLSASADETLRLWDVATRNRHLSKEYERKVQTSETLIEVAMIRLLVSRVARPTS